MTHMTFDDIFNPGGKGASTMQIGLLTRNLEDRYNRLIAGDVSYEILSKKGHYLIHFKVPSEENADYREKIYYDVVFELIPTGKPSDNTSPGIYEYGVRAFSNCPSFTFTYTHLYKNKGLLPSPLPFRLYSKTALKEPSSTRNPRGDLGIEKSLWFAATYMRKNRLFNKDHLDSLSDTKSSVNSIINDVKSQDDKMVEIGNRKKNGHKLNTPAKNKASELPAEFLTESKKIGMLQSSLKDNKQSNLNNSSLSVARTAKLNGGLKSTILNSGLSKKKK